jgi:predicted ATPase
MSVFIEKITIKNLLSFDEEGIVDFELKPLNVLIGANASGKSNFVKALKLLCSTATGISAQVGAFGGMSDLLHKNSDRQNLRLKVQLVQSGLEVGAEYSLELGSNYGFLALADESLNLCRTGSKARKKPESYPLFARSGDKAWLLATKKSEGNGSELSFETQELGPKEFDFSKSIFEQRKDPVIYPAITSIGEIFSRSSFGGFLDPSDIDRARASNKADDFAWYLWRDSSNLPIILSKLDKAGILRSEILPRLRQFYPGITDIRTLVEEGRVGLGVWEEALRMPLSLNSMSSGTIAFLRILTALFNPEPFSQDRIFCFEEPETGFHPEALPLLAECLKEAPATAQIFVTTHSPQLVECFQPEDIVIVEKPFASTKLERKSRTELKRWLKRYTLGELWLKGVIGGTRN